MARSQLLEFEWAGGDPVVGGAKLIEELSSKSWSFVLIPLEAASTSRSTGGSAVNRYSITAASWPCRPGDR
jgi:hypothetical protein